MVKKVVKSFTQPLSRLKHLQNIVRHPTSSSVVSTQRIENSGRRWAKPSSGGFEQLVTNYK